MKQMPGLMRLAGEEACFFCFQAFSLLLVSVLIACSGSKYPPSYPFSVSLVGSGSGRVSSNQPAHIDCGAMCTASLETGSRIVLTAEPAAGSDFIGWSGSCSGTAPCTLMIDGAKTVSARFSWPRIVFTSGLGPDGNAPFNIWLVNADGTGFVPLTNATTHRADSGAPQWSPDGSRVVFESARRLDGTDEVNGNGIKNIWRVNADGTDLRPLTTGTTVSSLAPRWSPDGSQVVFTSARRLDGADGLNENHTSNLWLVNSDGTHLRPLTTVTANHADSYEPHWSPDGTRIVFHSGRKLDGTDAVGTATNIWRVNTDGSGLTPITTTTVAGAGGASPRWSPNGTRIAFVSARNLDGTDAISGNITANIWRVNSDGTGLAPITNATAAGASSTSPQWSPDGAQLVFHSGRRRDGADASGISNIWRVNADGAGLLPLTNVTVFGWNLDTDAPQWSPDGARVVFQSPNAHFSLSVWRVNADGTGLVELTNAPFVWSMSPSFSP